MDFTALKVSEWWCMNVCRAELVALSGLLTYGQHAQLKARSTHELAYAASCHAGSSQCWRQGFLSSMHLA